MRIHVLTLALIVTDQSPFTYGGGGIHCPNVACCHRLPYIAYVNVACCHQAAQGLFMLPCTSIKVYLLLNPALIKLEPEIFVLFLHF